MDPVVKKALDVAKAGAGPLLKWLRRLRAEKAAADAPEKFKAIDQATLDGVLRRIAAADHTDSIFTHFYDAATNRLFTPDFLKTQNVQDWLQKPSVRHDLQRVATARLLGVPIPKDAVERLETGYGEAAIASAQESAPVVAAISAMLAAGVTARVEDTGTAAMVAASSKENARGFEGVNAKLDSLLSGGADEPLVAVAPTPPDTETANAWRDSFRAASSGLLHWPTTLGDGEHLARPELDQLLETTQCKKRGTVALLGLPGSGKSALLARLGQELAATPSVAVLAIKGDLLDASVATEADLQRDLQLPELPSIMLRRLAMAGPVVLLIDQLDALAGHLDAKTGRLSALLNLVKAVSEVDGLHVFVSCRTFEFTHDLRLSRIEAESLALELPSWEKVLPILEAHGVKAAGWNSDAREVLRVPQQLNTYLQLRSSGIDEPVSNYTAMLDRLWKVRVLDAPGGERAAQLAFEIAEAMADKEALWLASARFDHRVEDVTFLVSTGILTTSEQGAIGFSHQTVFEHVLARSFAKNDGRLSAYVLARTESLFVRPKLWAALAYLRGVEQETYEAELAAIWNAPGLRKHLRFLLIEFMGSQPKPTDKEELLLAGASEQPELRALVLKAITGSRGWFERFGSNLIAQAMADEKRADLCVQLLAAAWSFGPERVERLLREIWLPAPANDRRALFVLQEALAWTPAMVEVAKTIATRVELTAFHVDHFVAVIGDTEPKIAIDLLRHFLDGELSRLETEALRLKAIAEREKPAEGEGDVAWHMEHNPLRPLENLLGDRHHWNSVPELAAASPSHFIAVLWPWYLSVFRGFLALSASDEPYFGYPLQYRADFRFEGEDSNKLEPSSLLEAIVVAVEQLAESAPQELLQWVDEQANLELAPVQRLLAHGLAHNHAQTAAAALTFLLGDERRFFLGGVSDSSSTTLALVAACAPHWSTEEVERFTTKVKAYSPARPAEQETPDAIRFWHRIVRRTRINLLRALPTQARSPAIQREVEEGNRALPQHSPLDDFVGGWIGSPMDATQFARATNDDIVNAFKKIPDKSGWDHPKEFGRGGNIQLARAFAEFAKEHPARGLEVIQLLRPTFGQRAAGYALDALAEKSDPAEVMMLIVALHERGFSDEEFKSSVARAVDRLLGRGVIISEPVLAVLEGWVPTVTNVPAPEDAADEQKDDGTKDNGFLLSGHQRVEFVPGGDYPIVSAIVHARFARKEVPAIIQLLRRYLRVTGDKRVWGSLMNSMAPIPSMDAQEGPVLIGEVLSLPQLDGSRGAAVLMAKTHWKALKEVMSNLRRWHDSENVAARKGYGELVALIALANSEGQQARQWLDELVDAPGLTDARAGASATAVQLLWPEPQFRAGATDLLLRLLAKNEAAIWREIFGLFGMVDKLEPEPHTVRLLKAIANNIDRAPAPSEPYVVERLGTLLPRHADIVARIASQLIQLWRDQLANMGSALLSAGQEIIDLAVTLHRTEGTKLQGLQMFEQLIEIDAYQAREVLDEIDHRVRSGARTLRPRLRRKVRRSARQVS
jgi:hypothetical protein